MGALAMAADGVVHYVPAPRTACGLTAGGRGTDIRNVTCPECLARIEKIRKHIEATPPADQETAQRKDRE